MLFISCLRRFKREFFVLCKQYLLMQQEAVCKKEMGKRSRAFISGIYKLDLIENKENIREATMAKDRKKNKSLKNSETAKSERISNNYKNNEKKMQKEVPPLPKTVGSIDKIKFAGASKVLKKELALNDCSNSTKVSETEKTEETANSTMLCDSSQSIRSKLRKQHSSEIEENKQLGCASNELQKPENAIVVLQRIECSDQETISLGPDVTLKDAGNAKNSYSKLKNNLSRCECHSNLLLKEAIVVLERLDDNQGNVVMTKVEGKAKEVPNKSNKGTKRKREEKTEDKNTSKSTKSKKPKDSNETKNTKKEKIPDVTALDFSNDSKSPSGNKWNFKISSWNINGIRAWLEKNGISYLHHEQPDILCIQETKCADDKIPDEVKEIEGYHTYWLAGDKDGYSGVGLLTKEEPIKVEYGIGVSEHDNEGRVITAEYEKFYLVNAYVPNAGRGLVRLDYRMKWDKDFREYLKKLDAKKPIILTGDLNVAHEEIDLANPKTNKKNAGFTKEEREGFSAHLKEGFIDTFRHLYPDLKGAYTFWTYMMNARAKNVGWRLDYFVVSERFIENLCDNVIRKDVFGSDHCPITLFLSL